jgi:hypothetical protein
MAAVRISQLKSVPLVISKLLRKAYEKCGGRIGLKLTRLAHQLGHGTDAAVTRLLKELESREERLVRPAHLRCEVGGILERDCWNLLKYALPSVCFSLRVNLVRLIRFQGLRLAPPS